MVTIKPCLAKSPSVMSCSPVFRSFASEKTIALLGVPMTRMFAKDEAKAVENPTIQGCVPEILAIGTVMGPTAETVAPSLIRLVSTPVNRLEATQSPAPLDRASGRIRTNASAIGLLRTVFFHLGVDFNFQASLGMHHQRSSQLDLLDRQGERQLGLAGHVRDGLRHRFEAKDGRQEVGALVHMNADVGIPSEIELGPAGQRAAWVEGHNANDEPMGARDRGHRRLPGIDCSEARRDDDLPRAGVARHQLHEPFRALFDWNRVDA